MEPAPAGPAGRDEVTLRLASAAPALGPRLAEDLRPAIRFAVRREPDAAMDIGHSKFGGAPDLPRGTPWPTWDGPDGERHPLQFFAQVDLRAAAEAAPGPLGLPAEGQLSFFAAFSDGGDGLGGPHRHGGGWGTRPPEEPRVGAPSGAANPPPRSAVLYSPPRALCVRCSPRIAPLPSGQLHFLGRWTWPPPVADGRADGQADRQAVEEVDATYEAELRAAVPEGWSFTGRHQFGGHPRSGFDPGGAQRLLLLLDSDEILEVRWGDAGMLSWAASGDDLAAGRWDAVTFSIQPS